MGFQTPSLKPVLGARRRVGFRTYTDVVALKVKRVSCHKSVALHSNQLSDALKITRCLIVLRHHERKMRVRAFNQTEGGGHNIHFPITNHNVAVSAEALHMLVLVNIVMVRIEKITMTQHQVSERIIRLILTFGVSPEYVENGPAAMYASGYVAVGIKVRPLPGYSKPLIS